MTLSKFICDRCGKEADCQELHRVEIYTDRRDNWLVTSEFDFCESCAEEIAECAKV